VRRRAAALVAGRACSTVACGMCLHVPACAACAAKRCLLCYAWQGSCLPWACLPWALRFCEATALACRMQGGAPAHPLLRCRVRSSAGGVGGIAAAACAAQSLGSGAWATAGRVHSFGRGEPMQRRPRARASKPAASHARCSGGARAMRAWRGARCVLRLLMASSLPAVQCFVG